MFDLLQDVLAFMCGLSVLGILVLRGKRAKAVAATLLLGMVGAALEALRLEVDPEHAAKRAAEAQAEWLETERARVHQVAENVLDVVRDAERQKAAELQQVATLKREADEEKRCRMDSACWGKKHWSNAITRCMQRVEMLAKYEVEWDTGFSTTNFVPVAWAPDAKAVVVYVGDNVKFQNGFGAFLRHNYRCSFDTTRGIVVDLDVAPGRLM
jgi:hypothetical protein